MSDYTGTLTGLVIKFIRHTGRTHNTQWHTVWVEKIPLRFSDIFPKRLGIF